MMIIGTGSHPYHYGCTDKTAPVKHKQIPGEDQDGCPKDAVGMPGHRHRRSDGRLVAKRGDTLVSTLRKKERVSIPKSVPADTPLKVLREITGKTGVHQVSIAMRELEQAGALQGMLLSR